MKKRILALVLSMGLLLHMTLPGTLAVSLDEAGTVSTFTTDLSCTQEEHTHDDTCRATEPGCGLTETEGHTHSDSCMEMTVSCALPEDENHTHEDGCYTQSIICGQEEVAAHSHTADCYALICEKTEHQHADGCYTVQETTVPETTAAPETTVPPETTPETVTEPAEAPLLDQIMAAGTLTELRDLLNDENNYSALLTLTEAQIEQVETHAVALNEADPDAEAYENIQETLTALREKLGYADCTCGQEPHTADCPLFEGEKSGTFADFTQTAGGTISAGTYQLTGNTTLTGTLNVASGTSVTLDLNGYVLQGTQDFNATLIQVNGTLKIIDSQPTRAHEGYVEDDVWKWGSGENEMPISGGIIYNNCTSTIETIHAISVRGNCTIEGGTIAGFQGAYGCAVVVTSGGTLSMTDSKVVYNKVTTKEDNAWRAGAVYGEPSHNNRGSQIVLTNVEFTGNSSNGNGGALCGYNVTLTNCTFQNNSAANGGAVYIRRDSDSSANGSLIIDGGVYRHNIASVLYKGAGSGGAIYCEADVSLDIKNEAKIYKNICYNSGGGIYSAGQSKIDNSVIDSNYAAILGGGVYLRASAKITDSKITNNRAMTTETSTTTTAKEGKGRGGGMCIVGSSTTVTLEDSNVDGNAAMFYGGGIQVQDYAKLELISGTINNNEAVLHGAGAIHVTNHAEFTITGGVISGNKAYSVGGAIHSSYSCVLQLNGGTISNNIVYGRGGGVHVNVGGNLTLNGTNITGNKAYNGKFRISSTVDIENLTWSEPVCVDTGNDGYGGGVVVDAGTCVIKGGKLSDNYAETGGGGIALVMINTAATPTLFPQNKVVTLEIEGGEITGNQTDGNGGAIYLMRNKLTWEDIQASGKTDLIEAELYIEGTPFINASGGIVKDNYAKGNGGAAYQEEKTEFTISGTAVFSNNTAEQHGGAVYIASGKANVEGGQMTNNIAKQNGGAIAIGVGSVMMTGGEISSNKAANGAGAYLPGGSFTMISGSMTNNGSVTDTQYGGAVYVNGGDITIGLEDCAGGTVDTKHTQSYSHLNHPVLLNNMATFGGGLSVSGGNAYIYCGTIKTNVSDNAGTGMNIFIDGGNLTHDMDSSDIGGVDEHGDEDHGIVCVGGSMTIVSEKTTLTIKLAYHSNWDTDQLGVEIVWEGSAPDDYWLNLPWCPEIWENKQNQYGLTFVGWTENAEDATAENIRMTTDYFPIGDNFLVDKDSDSVKYDETTGQYTMHLYAVWAPFTNYITYAYSLDAEVEGEVSLTNYWTGTVKANNADGVDIFANATRTAPTTYQFTASTTSVDVPDPYVPGYTFVGWKMYAKTDKISNWGLDAYDSVTQQTVNEVTSLTQIAAKWYGLQYIWPGQVQQNFGDITLVAVFTENKNDFTYIMMGPEGTECGTIVLANGTSTFGLEEIDSEVEEDIPVSTGTVSGATATPAPGFKVAGWFTDADCTQPVTTELATVTWAADGSSTLIPNKINGLWVGNTFYALVEYAIADLTITTSDLDAEYSYIFTISGTPYDTAISFTPMTIVIDGNDSKTIKSLPVGEYTVTESSGWSWRFEVESDSAKAVTVDGSQAHSVTFTTYSTTNYLWLDGSAYRRKKEG